MELLHRPLMRTRLSLVSVAVVALGATAILASPALRAVTRPEAIAQCESYAAIFMAANPGKCGVCFNWTTANGSEGYAKFTDDNGPAGYKGVRFSPYGPGGCSGNQSGPQFFFWNSAGPAVDPNKNNDACPASGNPIHTALGYKVESETDFDFGNGLAFTRRYSSGSHWGDSRIGHHWRDSFQRRIVPSAPTALASAFLTVERPNGDKYTFEKKEEHFANVIHVWEPEPDVRLSLQPVLNGSTHQGWTLLDVDNSIETYDVGGRLTAIEHPQRGKLLFAYDGNNLDTVTDRHGRSLQFEYDTNNRIETITGPAGEVFTYEYHANGALENVWSPGESGPVVRTYEYDNSQYPYALTGLIDENQNRYATWEYDTQGRATASFHGPALDPIDRVELAYLTNGTTEVTDPLGQIRTYGFSSSHGVKRFASVSQPCPQCGGSNSASRTYDANGFLDKSTDFSGVETDHDYNTRGLEFKRVEANKKGAVTNLPEKRTIETDWHATFRLPTERRTKNAAGTLVAKTSWTYNARGQVLTETHTDPANSAARVTTTAYCESADITAGTCPILGLVTSVDGPRTDLSDLTTYTYYAADHASCASAPTTCPYRKGDLWKVTNALGQVTETLAYDGAGRVLSHKDANGVVTDLEYHPRGWLTARKVRGTNGSSETDDAITRFAYDAVGQVTRVTQPDGDYLDYEYDEAHRLDAIEDALGNRIEYTLDDTGNRTAEVTKNDAGAVTRSLSRVYDQLNRLDLLKDAYDHETDFGYDASGNQTSAVDALDTETRQTYDPLHRLASTIQDYAGLDVTTGYAYDALDRLTTVTDPKGLATSYQYDGLGNLTQLTSPDTGVTGYTHDAAGNRLTQTDARGITATHTYDALNRLTAITYTDTSANVAFAYDQSDGTTGCSSSFPLGRLTRLTDGSGSTTYCYDRWGNISKKTQVVGSVTLSTSYAYTLGSRLKSVTYPSGAKIQYTRDSLGRIQAVERIVGLSTTDVVDDVSYLPFGPVTQIDFSDSGNLDFAYDANYAIDTVGGAFLALDLEVNEIGNIVGLDAASAADERVYSYDPLSRLSEARDGNAALIEGFTYDGTGNRLTKQSSTSTQTYGYPSSSHRLTSIDATTRSYDAMGSLTDRGDGWTFEYDPRQRLKVVKQGGNAKQTNVYNGKGERIRKLLHSGTGGSASNYFVYDESGKLLADYYHESGMSSPQLRKEYIWLDDRPVAVRVHAGAYAGETLTIHSDHLGTPRAIVVPHDEDVVWRWDFEVSVFGEHAAEQDPDGDRTNFEFNLRFPGQYFDSQSGLHYNYMRHYDSAVGRFVESDPLGLGGGLSTFAYVGNDPIAWLDPLGLKRVPLLLFSTSRVRDYVMLGLGRDAYGKIVSGCLAPRMEGCVQLRTRTFTLTAEAKNCDLSYSQADVRFTNIQGGWESATRDWESAIPYTEYDVLFLAIWVYKDKNSCAVCKFSDFQIESSNENQ